MDYPAIFRGVASGLPQVLLPLWPWWLLLGAISAVKYAFHVYEKRRLSASGIGEIDRMDGKTFEKYLEALFERLGYTVELTRYIGDYGADLVTGKDGIKTIVQAKRYQRRVGVKAIQEAVAAKGYYGCSEAMVVTNSFFTRQAMELARANGVALWGRDRLVRALLSVKTDPMMQTTMVVGTDPAVSHRPFPQGAASSPGVPEPSTCATCAKPVSEKVREYCESRPEQFHGKVYCYPHQRSVRQDLEAESALAPN